MDGRRGSMSAFENTRRPETAPARVHQPTHTEEMPGRASLHGLNPASRALHFLKGEDRLNEQVLVGLHQLFHLPETVARIRRARERGAKLAAHMRFTTAQLA